MRAGTLVIGLPVIVAVVIGLLWPQSSLRYAVHTLPADESALVMARDAGFDTIVELFSWREIEPTQDQFFWQRPDEVVAGAQYHGLDLVVRLDQHPVWASPVSTELNAPPTDLADYAAFVSRVAERYRGRVLGYVIWNEPNLAAEWGGEAPDPEGYSELLCQAYEAIKAKDSNALVVSAGLASTNHMDPLAMDDRHFLEAMLEAGAETCFDVLGAHPYGFAYPPYDPRGAHEGLNLARIQDLRDILVARGLESRSIWATEMGWTVDARGQNGWQAVTLQEQADFLVEALERGREEWPWLGLMSVWNLNGNGNANWKGYSVLDSEGQPRLAYRALQQWLGDRSSRPYQVRLQQSFSEHPVLAPDSVVHLGDSDFSEPWMPLFDNRNPSTAWRGTVYVDDPGNRPWWLSLRVMQPNVWDNYVWINGRRLEPAMPQEDFSGSWVSLTWPVPAHWLQPGANEVAVAIGRTLPVLQDEGFAWDDLQLKDVVLWGE